MRQGNAATVLERSEEDDYTWGVLLDGYRARLSSLGCREVIEGLERLRIGNTVEDISRLSEKVHALSGWRLEAVDGLIPEAAFFALLNRKIYPMVNHVRSRSELDFAELPDTFHDALGHLPLLVHAPYARFLERYASVAVRYLECEPVARALGRLYWYTAETGLVLEDGEERVFGAAILTSRAECENVASVRTDKLPFDLERVFATSYDNFKIQPWYFVIDSFDALLGIAEHLEQSAARLSKSNTRRSVALVPATKREKTVLRSPNACVIQPYEPGLTIDFREPPDTTDIEELRRQFHARRLATSTEDELVREAGQALVDLGVADHERDFAESLSAHTGETRLGLQLERSLRRLGVENPPRDPQAAITLLLEATGCLDRPAHHAARLLCHSPEEPTLLEDDATHYGVMIDGACTVTANGRTTALRSHTFFCIGGAGVVEGSGKCVLVTRFGFRGLTLIGGDVEDWGRLRYIDGCTDTLLVAPPKKGDPCLNALYFPPATKQTAHVHPSIRCGAVIDGAGVCRTPKGDFPLNAGDIFFLPPETYHSFCTEDVPTVGRSALTVVAFHPDSDFGPTDEDHPMVNRTYFKFLHRLRSSIASRPASSGADDGR